METETIRQDRKIKNSIILDALNFIVNFICGIGVAIFSLVLLFDVYSVIVYNCDFGRFLIFEGMSVITIWGIISMIILSIKFIRWYVKPCKDR